MRTYDRDEYAGPAVTGVFGETAEDRVPDRSLAAACRELGRIIVGWLTLVIIVGAAACFWGWAP